MTTQCSRCRSWSAASAMALCLALPLSPVPGAQIDHDPMIHTVTVSDAGGTLMLRLRYDHRCLIDCLNVRGHQVVVPETGVCSAIRLGNTWHTTREGIATPKLTVVPKSVTFDGIRFGSEAMKVDESWTFTPGADRITWKIERTYPAGGAIEDTYFPGFDFASMTTWTGALLGNGGVAWCKLFDKPMATYGLHTGPVTFWNQGNGACLRIEPAVGVNQHSAVRFSRHPSGTFSFNYSISDEPLSPRYTQYRFLPDKHDVWAPLKVSPVNQTVEYTLSAPDYAKTYDRGRLQGIDGAAVRELLNTIGRIGAVDDTFHGTNGWYSGYCCLHEPWIAQMGLAIDDPYYFSAHARTLDNFRDHAIKPDGRVLARWAYGPYDAMPGTYDKNGFYECQWGYLLDTQTCWVLNVADQFNFTGDVDWLRRHKIGCEKALDYLLRRDSNGNGLVEMMTDSHKEAKGSDWIDVIWAAFENAYVNAQLFEATRLWAELEDLLGDAPQAHRYRQVAGRIKEAFNKPIAEGGFWNPDRRWYVYWRDKDGSIHGDNLCVPVNFMAVGYGLCDDADRCKAILDEVEKVMQAERLFFWPLCLYSYQHEEVYKVNWPFPNYENGDLFLAWGEMGTRAYARHDPKIAVRVVRSVLERYAKDGLAFQRYLRKDQRGEGNDILSNNCMPVVGLYRNIYGVQPKYNRLYLEPHLTPELAGTQLRYWLRGQVYTIEPGLDVHRVVVDGVSVHDRKPFGLSVAADRVDYFAGDRPRPSMSIVRPTKADMEIRVESWSDTGPDQRRWSLAGRGLQTVAQCRVTDLKPDTDYALYRNGTAAGTLHADAAGHVTFKCAGISQAPQVSYQLRR